MGWGVLGGLPPQGRGTGGRRKSRGPREQPGNLTEFRPAGGLYVYYSLIKLYSQRTDDHSRDSSHAGRCLGHLCGHEMIRGSRSRPSRGCTEQEQRVRPASSVSVIRTVACGPEATPGPDLTYTRELGPDPSRAPCPCWPRLLCPSGSAGSFSSVQPGRG